jgi:hypothetical protein
VTDWPRQALDALTEAQAMSEAITAIVETIIDRDAAGKAYSLLDAILACTKRLDVAVDPAIDVCPREVLHG